MKRKVHQVPRKQTDSHNVMFKMSAFGLNTSRQVCWPLVNCTINAPGCTTQLRDVRGLPLPVRSCKPLLCTFLYNFLFLFVSSSYQKIPESVAEHCSLFIPISFPLLLFQINHDCVFFSISLKYLPVIYLSLHDNDVMFTL